MAGKEPLRILAFALCAVSFAFLSVAIYTDHWRENANVQGNFGIGSTEEFEGIWNNCWWESTGETHCYPQPYGRLYTKGGVLALPSRFYFYRGLCIIGILTNFIGLLFLMSGLKCMDISFHRKVKMQMGAGLNFVTAACALVTFILFKINEWQNQNARGSSLGKGMYLLIGTVVFEIAAVGLAFAGMESDDADYLDDDNSYQPKGFQPGSIVNSHGQASGYV